MMEPLPARLKALAPGPLADFHDIVSPDRNQDEPVRIQRSGAGTVPPRRVGLIARHWVITDSDKHEQEVKGLGVVGHQPLLKPGEQFEYTSWAVIATPVGTMRGEYFCVAEDGERFEAPVPEFVLRMPRTLH
jgi:ApaG protein